MAEGSAEFDDAVRLFYSTLQELRGRIRVIRVGGAMGGSKWGWGSQWDLRGSWWGLGVSMGPGGLLVGLGVSMGSGGLLVRVGGLNGAWGAPGEGWGSVNGVGGLQVGSGGN